MTANRSAFLRGVSHSLPFFVVILPFAMLFGLLASKAGLNLFEIMSFSVVVFAGASQFAALQLLQEQAPVLIILATSLAVNLRMMMYSVALAPHLGRAPLGTRAVISYFLVDQSFALSMAEFEKRPAMGMAEKVAYFFGTVTPLTLMWNGSTLLGAALGRSIPPEYALDFALPITFLAMVAPMIRTKPHAVAAAVSVSGALALWFMPFGTGVLVAGGLGMAAGALSEVWLEGRAKP